MPARTTYTVERGAAGLSSTAWYTPLVGVSACSARVANAALAPRRTARHDERNPGRCALTEQSGGSRAQDHDRYHNLPDVHGSLDSS